MLELTYIGTAQTVAGGDPVLYNTHTVKTCGCPIKWRKGSGTVRLPKGRYSILFSGNVQIPADGTAGEVTFGVRLDGETIDGTTMRVTPGAVSRYMNIATQTIVNVDCGCEAVNVINLGTADILVDSPNLTIARV